jgi:tRNA(fMet)-specific endonuclease VapC
VAPVVSTEGAAPEESREMIVLDTDHVTLLGRPDSPLAYRLRARLQQSFPVEWATTIVTYEEQSRGWLANVARARTVRQQIEAYKDLIDHLEAFRDLHVLRFDEASGRVFERLRKERIRIGTQDLKIAAIAIAYDGHLKSRNLRDFQRVPGLQVEDWTV